MCGIAGIVEMTGARTVHRPTLEAMADIQRHRGPDGGGVHLMGKVGLTHRRLAVIDVEGGAQPMGLEDEDLWVTHNGEIYNFQELARELAGLGRRFRTRSDTEVLLHAYAVWGLDFLERIEGMFAFALLDGRARRLLLARDRLGVKPLVYALEGGRLLFASEIKALLAAGASKDIDEAALADYLAFGYVPAPRSIYRVIRKLEPGHFVVLSLDGDVPASISPRRYWDVVFDPGAAGLDDREAEEAALGLLRAAVRKRLVSDVPLGALLSGGVDSSTVVALLCDLTQGPVRTFTVGFDEVDHDEIHHARRVSQHLETVHHELRLRPVEFGLLEDLIDHFDEPFADASALPTYLVARAARETVTVAISGDGGDEAFGGYTHYRRASPLRWLDIFPARLRADLAGAVAPMVPDSSRWSTFLERGTLSALERHAHIWRFFGPHAWRQLLVPPLSRRLAGHRPIALYERTDGRGRGRRQDTPGRLQYLDLMTYLPGDVLPKVDIASMKTSLEVRSPFLDHHLIEFAARLPLRQRLAWGSGKRLLRRLARRMLPAEIARRPKQGFNVPLQRWFEGDLRAHTRARLMGRDSCLRGWIREDSLRRLLDRQGHGTLDTGPRTWALLVLERWLRKNLC